MAGGVLAESGRALTGNHAASATPALNAAAMVSRVRTPRRISAGRVDRVEVAIYPMACRLRQRLRLTHQPGGLETGGARGVQLLDDIGQEQQVAGLLAHGFGDAAIGLRLALGPGFRIEIAGEQGR